MPAKTSKKLTTAKTATKSAKATTPAAPPAKPAGNPPGTKPVTLTQPAKKSSNSDSSPPPKKTPKKPASSLGNNKPLPKVSTKTSAKDTASATLDEKKLNDLAKIGDLEEFYFLISVLKEKQINTFIEHYKQSSPDPSKNKIAQLITQAKTHKELIASLKEEMVTHLKDQQEKIKQEISTERKKGQDMFDESIKIMSAPLKINVYAATQNRDDFFKVKKMMQHIEESVTKKRTERESAEKAREELKKADKTIKEHLKDPDKPTQLASTKTTPATTTKKPTETKEPTRNSLDHNKPQPEQKPTEKSKTTSSAHQSSQQEVQNP